MRFLTLALLYAFAQLSHLPVGLFGLRSLTELDVSNNKLTSLPDGNHTEFSQTLFAFTANDSVCKMLACL